MNFGYIKKPYEDINEHMVKSFDKNKVKHHHHKRKEFNTLQGDDFPVKKAETEKKKVIPMSPISAVFREEEAIPLSRKRRSHSEKKKRDNDIVKPLSTEKIKKRPPVFQAGGLFFSQILKGVIGGDVQLYCNI